MSNLDKLSQMDLSDINIEEITKTLSEHQNTFIKAFFVLASLVIAVMMLMNQHKKEQGIHFQMSQAQAKLQAIKSHDTAIQDFKNFQSSLLQPVNEVELISIINNLAKEGHVDISSPNPTEEKDMGLYTQIDVSFSSRSDDFRTMMLFLRKIERTSYPLRINSWSGHEQEDGKILFSVNISAVLIHS